MTLFAAQSSRGAILVWRQSTGAAAAPTGTAAPRPKFQVMSRGQRSYVYAKTRGAFVGSSFNVAWARNANVLIGTM